MPSNSNQRIQQGIAHHRAGDLKAAKADYAAALEDAPGDAEAWHLLGQLLHGEGDTEAAISHVTRALELDPALAGAAFNLAVLYEQADNGQAAEAHFKAHLEGEPEDIAALFALARLQHRHGQREAAAANYRRLLGLDASHLGGRINLGACLNEMDRPGDAIQELDQALAAAPDDAVALNNMGMANQALGRNEAAQRYLARAHRAQAGNPVIAANLVRSNLRLGHYGAGLAVLNSALEAAPNHGPLRVLSALALPYIAKSSGAMARARTRMEAEIDRLEALDAPIADPLSEVGMTNFQAVYHGLDDRPMNQALAAFYARNCPDRAWWIGPGCRPRRRRPHAARRLTGRPGGDRRGPPGYSLLPRYRHGADELFSGLCPSGAPAMRDLGPSGYHRPAGDGLFSLQQNGRTRRRRRILYRTADPFGPAGCLLPAAGNPG